MMMLPPAWRRQKFSAATASPLASYQQRVGAGELRADRAQLAAMRRLNALHRAMLRHHQRPGWRNWRRALGPRPALRGLYLWGGVGTGKTLMMDIFYHALPAGVARRVHFHRFMLAVHEALRDLPERRDPLAIIAAQLAARHRALCLDEFSVGDITDAMLLSGLLRELFAHGVALVTTSNTHPQQLYLNGLQRQRFLPAIALIQAHTRVICVDGGSDYRLAKLRLDALYHVPHDQRAMRALRASFAHLDAAVSADSTPAPSMLRLAGREVAAVQVGRGVVWFDFATLCGARRSKVDYIELAKRFHSVILADIPYLTAEQDDAARRLLELVDELYDRGVNLLVSAAARPGDLYRGRGLKQPFERAASRLREMSSADYLARPHVP